MQKNEPLSQYLTPEVKEIITRLITSGELDSDQHTKTSAEDPSLEDLLERNKDGIVRSTNRNCQLILEHDCLLKDAVRYNELTGQMNVVKDMPWKRFDLGFDQNDLDHIITHIEERYGISNDRLIERAVRVISKEKAYHPIRDLLDNLVWDGENRLDKVLTKYLGVKATPLATESLKIFMLGAISRVFHPGCKFEYMLCLVGGQGAGKSTFLRFLALEDDWFTDDLRELNSKAVFEHLSGHWILEIPEMLAILQAKSVEETKSFISRLSDNYRTPYDKYAVDHPRQCVFAGTSNKIAFLPPDKSGNRRFLPIEVDTENAETHILADPDGARAYFRQLWAEVMVIYRSGNFRLALTREMEEDQRDAQNKYMPEDPMETDIVNFIRKEQPKYVCTKMLFVEALGHSSFDTLEMWQSNLIGEIMNQCFSKEYRRLSSHNFPGYGIQRAWIRLTPEAQPEFTPVSPEQRSEVPFPTDIPINI